VERQPEEAGEEGDQEPDDERISVTLNPAATRLALTVPAGSG
jgi:hypothetical protein